jgi:hypothetical protein
MLKTGGQPGKLIRAVLRKEPDSHWLLTRLGLAYCEERNYKKALHGFFQ